MTTPLGDTHTYTITVNQIDQQHLIFERNINKHDDVVGIHFLPLSHH